jgi:hypothetical protein
VNIECGVVFAVPDRMDAEALEKRLFWRADQGAIDVGEWEAGTGPEPEELSLILASPILSAELNQSGDLTLHWRADVEHDQQVSISVGGADWVAVQRVAPAINLAADARSDALRVREDGTSQEWTVPIIGPTGHVCWSPPRFDTHTEAMAALLDFPMRPAEASGDDEGSDDEGDEAGDVADAATAPAEDNSKSYALHAAAELLEQTAALQRSLDPSMLDDWLDHIDRFFHASFPASLIATWREHRIDVFTHLAKSALRPPSMTSKQRARYEAILEAVAHAWGLR